MALSMALERQQNRSYYASVTQPGSGSGRTAGGPSMRGRDGGRRLTKQAARVTLRQREQAASVRNQATGPGLQAGDARRVSASPSFLNRAGSRAW